MMIKTVLCLLFAISFLQGIAQQQLPDFSVSNKGKNRIIVSWTNPYGEGIHQISIQRSFDSLKNFKTVMTLPDPTVPQNGYSDMKAENDHMFYRLFLLFDSGRYQFSRSHRPILDLSSPTVEQTADTQSVVIIKPVPEKQPVAPPVTAEKPKPVPKPVIPEKMLILKKRDTILGEISAKYVKRFKDSINLKTKDTFSLAGPDTILIKVFVPREIYKPSKYVFTEKDGNVRVLLSDATTKHYSIKFFEEDNTPLFEIKKIPESPLVLDKTNFLHAGWYRFELYADGQLKEKHRLFIPKDF
jgi:hypothetical protein